MGKWQQNLDKILKYSQDVLSKHKTDSEFYKTKATAASEVVATHKQMEPRLKTYVSSMQTLLEAMGQVTAELSVYEDELEAAKKDKGNEGKTKTKELEKKMKPLAKQFEDKKKELQQLIKNYNDDKNALNDKIQALA